MGERRESEITRRVGEEKTGSRYQGERSRDEPRHVLFCPPDITHRINTPIVQLERSEARSKEDIEKRKQSRESSPPIHSCIATNLDFSTVHDSPHSPARLDPASK
jgi:hypothetical protein